MNDRGSAHHREADNHGSENGQRNVPAMAAMSVFAYRTWRRSMRRDPVPMYNSSLTGQMRVHEILNGHPRIIQDDEVDDVAFGIGPSTGPQHHETRRDAMNMLRDMMADDMWDRFQSTPWYRTTQALAS
ncbi:hypothetical protein TIFTF001_044358 [Ficus carica]|uniref:Uncharacterized protein n=1 Tax=Ficus carica TaxID=3494 RepID=A0AA88D7Q3_FICCA|nr:hypothetical protein TIFTF001_044358 [Ficus carica]